jgi:hypothetical protein
MLHRILASHARGPRSLSNMIRFSRLILQPISAPIPETSTYFFEAKPTPFRISPNFPPTPSAMSNSSSQLDHMTNGPVSLITFTILQKLISASSGPFHGLKFPSSTLHAPRNSTLKCSAGHALHLPLPQLLESCENTPYSRKALPKVVLSRFQAQSIIFLQSAQWSKRMSGRNTWLPDSRSRWKMWMRALLRF